MALTPGTRIGSYEITAQIGVGGMGEVYRATDTNLARAVAIKVLPEAVAADAVRLARFQREAEVLASLNHQNIAAIYGLERSDGSTALVMELVEGPTLADRIVEGPIPVDEAMPIARQIAEALEAAHERGIVHRDLKPANVKVRPDGTVKVLDFGLAKAMEPASALRASADRSAEQALSQSPTITTPTPRPGHGGQVMTEAGMILGTAAYMSPEQARGQTVDRRADIWAFGCVLYEMLAGRRAFSGQSWSDILAAVLKSDPDWVALPPLNARLRELLERCLDKDPRNRYQDMGDVRLDFRKITADPSPAPAVHGGETQSGTRLGWVALAAAGAVLAATAAWYVKPLPPTERHGRVEFIHALPDGVGFQNTRRQVVAISRTGERMIYNSTDGLRVRSMDDPEEVLVPAGTGWASPVFSPDAEEIAYFDLAPGSLMKTAIGRGEPSKLVEGTTLLTFGLSWEEDGFLYYGQEDGIWRVSNSGGDPERLVATQTGETAYGPHLLPGGEWILFTLTRAAGMTRWNEAEIVVQSIATEERKTLVQGGSDARYVGTGHLLYSVQDVVYARTFDVPSLEVGPQAVRVLQNVRRADSPDIYTPATFYGISDTGTMVWVPGTGAPGRTLVLVDRAGREEPLPLPPDEYVTARVSPDGSRVALAIGSPGDIKVLDLETGGLRTLTSDSANDRFPIWDRDGQRLFFRSDRDEGLGVYSIPAEGGSVTHLASSSEFQPTPWSVSRDGRIFAGAIVTTPQIRSWIVTLDMGGGEFESLLSDAGDTGYNEPSISPDGRWLAVTEGPTATPRVVLRPFPAVQEGGVSVSRVPPSRLLAELGGPVWSADGSELFYLSGGTSLMAVAVTYEPQLTIGEPQQLFQRRYQYGTIGENGVGGRAWDVTPDGRFLMITPPGRALPGGSSARINVVLNWTEELEGLLPTD